MGRWPKDLDCTVRQAEDMKWLARKVQQAKMACRMLHRAANEDGDQDPDEDSIIWECTSGYMALIDEFVDTVLEVVDNPLFWSEEIPLGQRAGFAVLLNSPLKPERVDT